MKKKTKDTLVDAGLVLTAFLVILGIALAYNACVYGDATCALAKCVKVKP